MQLWSAELSSPTFEIMISGREMWLLYKNIKFLKKQKYIKEVICVTQVNNLEDELKRSCNIIEIKELTGSKSNSDFKRDMRRISNLKKKLDDKNFDINKFWNTEPQNNYKHIKNEAKRVKY